MSFSMRWTGGWATPFRLGRASFLRNQRPPRIPRPSARSYTSEPPKPSSQPPPPTPTSRAERVLARLPPSLQKYTRGLRNAPVSHVVAFLILHELTAIVPLLGLFGLFHYTSYAPIDYVTTHYGGYVEQGVRRFERYFSRKGWFGFGAEDVANLPDAEESAQEVVLERLSSTDAKYKIVVEIALAYAITKALLPVRILGSLWATPWFARILGKLRRFGTK